LVLLVSLFAFRGRLIDLVGGALPSTPDSGLTLLGQYVDSWHTVGLGSSVNVPPWVALLGISSIITFFNAKALVSILFVLAIPLGFFGAYQLARKFTNLHFLALGAALLYAFAPVAISGLNSGRLGTVVLFVIGPWLVRALLGLEALENLNWRQTWWLALLLTLVFAFSPLTFLSLFIWQFILILLDVMAFNKNMFSKEVFDQRNARRIAISAAPIIACAPWSIELIIHPSRFLLDPGLAKAGGEPLSIMLGNPGGLGAPPIWLISPILFIALISLFVQKVSRLGEVAIFFIGIAMLFGSRNVAGHGSLEPEPLWVGSLLVIPTLVALLAGVIMINEYLPKISESHIDYRHFLLGSVSIVSILSIAISIPWLIATANEGPLQSKTRDALPAFLTVGAQTEERFKTLVIRSENDQTTFFIARDSDLILGEPDVLVGLSLVVNKSIVDLVTGAGIDSSKVLADFGIRYIFLARPLNDDLVRTIDGVGGFTRASKTNEGITWKVTDALPHVLFVTSDGRQITIPSGGTGAKGTLIQPGKLLITEKYDSRWKLLVNGRFVPSIESQSGVPIFNVLEPGEFTLYHDSTSRRAWVSLQIISFTALVVLALPARRRRSEMKLEELS
jgi:hypothetical protein